jgi:6-phosphogluconolactonase/glucosamine-6-phosphate isomerase/deaminase
MKIIKVKNPQEGVEVCKRLLYEKVSKNTALFLSGGSTPKILYEILVKEKLLKAGAVALIDERYFANLKSETNEEMIRQAGLVKYLEESKTRFYPILENKNMQDSARDYDETMRYVFNYFIKSIGILGVGVDGHTAGLPAYQEVSEQILNDKVSLVSNYDISMHHISIYHTPRITLTFLGLSKLDEIIVLVFGKDKRKALKLMLKEGSVAEIPSRFLNTKEITDKVTLITDQNIK